jgi:hypothetical protein
MNMKRTNTHRDFQDERISRKEARKIIAETLLTFER